jgi:hypothetical protein
MTFLNLYFFLFGLVSAYASGITPLGDVAPLAHTKQLYNDGKSALQIDWEVSGENIRIAVQLSSTIAHTWIVCKVNKGNRVRIVNAQFTVCNLPCKR